MKRLRKIVFWCHLPLGVAGGLVILVMCVTGVLLTYEKQITRWADTRSHSLSPSPEAQRMPVESLLANVSRERRVVPSAITLRAERTAPAEVSFGREAMVLVDPFSGQVLGEGSSQVRGFFRRVTDLHRWLGVQGENRPIAKAITGACNLAFLFLVASGSFMWFPQKWSRKLVRNVAWFKRGLKGKARDFNWHNVIGFWSAVPLFIVVVSGAVISYQWAGNLVYKLAGEAPPAQRANQPPNDRRDKAQADVAFKQIDPLWAKAEQQVAGWQSITLQIPNSVEAPLSFTIDQGNGGQPQKRSVLTLDRASGNVTRWEPFSSYSRGRQWRTILRFAHTGEIAGIAGQTIAGLASACGTLLVWTGLALAWRRLRAWRAKRAGKVTSPSIGELARESAAD
jgi:uncharacterized iron-regulated membrane protein